MKQIDFAYFFNKVYIKVALEKKKREQFFLNQLAHNKAILIFEKKCTFFSINFCLQK
jgi:hypothetical protein